MQRHSLLCRVAVTALRARTLGPGRGTCPQNSYNYVGYQTDGRYFRDHKRPEAGRSREFRGQTGWVAPSPASPFPWAGLLMPIRQYLDGERFDPETTRLLGIAFEFAIQALHNWVDDPPREAIARAIIGYAKAGERDHERLCDLAVEAYSKLIITDPSPLPPHAAPPVLPGSSS